MNLRPHWMEQTLQQITLQNHPLLYGNIDDYFIWQKQGKTDYVLLDEGIKRLITPYDPIFLHYDGIRLLEIHGSTGDLGLFHQVTECKPLVDAENESLGMLRGIHPAEAASICRRMLAQDHRFVVFLWDLADLLTNDRERYAESERHPIVDLRTGMTQAVIHDGYNEGHRSMLILTARDLNRVPVWLYQGNPLITLIQVTPPRREERKQYGLHFIRPGDQKPGFYGGERLGHASTVVGQASPLEMVADELADLSDGLTLREMVALRNTSHAEKIPIENGKVGKLVDYFRFGKQDDPWTRLDAHRVRAARATLARRVIGQEKAIGAVTRMLTTAQVGLTISPAQVGGKPRGVFFFVGPTGVGKTELAKAVAELVFGDERAFARFDMSEYAEEHSAERLTGAPPGFVGYAEGGQLTNCVRENPYRILLFDEVEKSHPLVLDKFLQILEDGRLTDGKGQTAYFHHTVIIFTSNIGAATLFSGHQSRRGAVDIDLPVGSALPSTDDASKVDPDPELFPNIERLTYDEVERRFRNAVNAHFTHTLGRPELYNRLGNGIVVFDVLRRKVVPLIAAKFLNALRDQAAEKFGIRLRFDASVEIALLRQMQDPDNLKMGGRRVRVRLEELIQDPLNEWLFEYADGIADLRGKTLVLRLGAFDRLDVEVLAS